MKKYLSVFALSCIPFFSFATEVDFKHVISVALENSNEVKISKKNIEKAVADLAVQEAGGLPNVSLNGSAIKTKTDGDEKNNTSLGVDLKYNVFNGGKTFNSINIAKNNKAKAITGHKKNIANIVVQVAKVYYGVKKSRILERSYTVALKNTKEIMNIEKIRFESGATDKTLYLNAQSNYYATKAKLLNIKTTISALNTQYYNFTGTDIPQGLPDADLTQLETIKSLDEAIKKAKANNLDVQMAKIDLQNSDYGYLISLAEHSPKLNLVGSVKRKNNLKDNEISGGISYSMALFSGGSDLAKTAKSKIQKQQSEIMFKKSMDDAEVSAINAWREYKLSKGELSAYKKSLDSLKMSLEMEQIRYKNKNTESTKLLDIQNKKINAEQMYVSAIEKSIIAVLNLLIVTGEFDLESLEKIK